MTFIDIPLKLDQLSGNRADAEIITQVIADRETARRLIAEERHLDALERTVEALRNLRLFSQQSNIEFRALVVQLLFDLAEIHFMLKDYKQSEKELEGLFKVLEFLINEDAERFGKYHILAMELSTRILRSRKKALETLVKHQLNAETLYQKVSDGMLEATDKLVDSLCNVGQILASAGDYRAAMKFYAEAIKFSKKRTGKVNRKEVKMTVEMAKIMMRVRQMRPRAKRLLNAILPHAIALETIQLEEDILALIEIIDTDIEKEPAWKTFLHNLNITRSHKKSEKMIEEENEEIERLRKAEEMEDRMEKLAADEKEFEKEVKKTEKKQKKETKKKKLE